MDGDRNKCKFEMSFNALLERQNGSTPESADNGDSLRHVKSGLSQRTKSSGNNNNIDDKREKEKTQNLIHLICWGPSWWSYSLFRVAPRILVTLAFVVGTLKSIMSIM